MPTGTVGTNARQDPRQVVNTLKKTINWNDNAANVAAAFANYLPRGAFITRALVEVVTTFNGTTPSLVVGTVGAAYNNIIAAGDVNLALAGVYDATRSLGRALANAADVLPFALYNNAGGSPSQGQAVVVIEYEGGWDT
jgi:hypothetical protein